MRRRLILLAALVAAVAAVAPAAHAASPSIVISQVYGGGGNAGATYTARLRRALQPRHDAPCRSTAGRSSTRARPARATSARPRRSSRRCRAWRSRPGSTYSSGGFERGRRRPLPAAVPTTRADQHGRRRRQGRARRRQRRRSAATAAPRRAPPTQLAQIIDLVGYGGAARTSSRAPARRRLRRDGRDFRAGSGCTDTDDNAADFAVGARRRATSRPTRTRAASSSTSLWSPPAVAR